MKKHYRHETDCLNCGATLQGNFCHVCGQENLEIKESFGHMMNHAVSDYFHFDHQFFHTLKPLLFKPGMLTTEYMAGRRTQYLHPIKMYIFISVVYFLLLFKSGHQIMNAQNDKNEPVNTQKVIDSIGKDPELSKAQKSKIVKAVQTYGPLTVTTDGADGNKSLKRLFATTADTSLAQYKAHQKKLSAKDRNGFFLRAINEKLLGYNDKYGDRAYEVFIEEFKHNIPKMMFLLLPVLALILRVSFRKNKKFYVEHLIFSFHFHCFLFITLTIDIILSMVIPSSWPWLVQAVDVVVSFYIMWYIYRSLRVVYQRSRIRTITKIIGIDIVYSVCFGLCLMLVLIITTLTSG